MKNSHVLHVVPLILALACASVSGQTNGSSTPPVIIEQGPHHNLWQYQTYEPGPDGKPVAKLHQYRELAAGLNYLHAGKWTASKEKIEAFSGGAVAQQGQCKTIFANNLNTAGAIDVLGTDGQRLRSHILGLIYVDASTGQSVLIAQLQDSEGELAADNQVLYPNAFAGVRADVRYTYRKDGLEQDVVLREKIPAPESYGLNSATTELEVATEFMEPPTAQVGKLNSDAGDSEDTDQTVRWGATSLGQGKAFSLNGQAAPVRVYKRYITVGGRYFLLEKVRLTDIKAGLAKLPDQASNARRLPGMASRHFAFPLAPAAKSAARPMRLAMGTLPDKGYVLDYNTLTTAYTNYTFQSDTTYYINGSLTLAGTNVFEGGTVIKYAANGAINFVAGQPQFLSRPFHPVVLTAKDDNHVGQTIGGSTGNPNGYYANPALNLSSLGSLALAEFRVSYANRALSVAGASPAIYDAQLVNCGTAVSDINSAVFLENVLLSNNKTNFNASTAASVYVANATVNNQFDLINGNTNTLLYLTNCVFVNATNLSGNIAAGYNGFYQAPMVGTAAVTNSFYPLQRAGAANCYLTNGCAFTNAGTAGVDPYLLGLLQAKTVYAPLVLSNLTFSVATNFSPRAWRDPNASALGYHYDPLDYAVSGVNVYSNMTFTAGTSVGWFELPNSGGAGCGFSIYDHVILSFNGTATAPCTFARYSTVQEGGNGLWSNLGYMGGIVSQSLSGGYGMNPTNAALISLNFTRCALLMEGPNQFRESGGGGLSQVVAQNSEIWNGNVGAYWDNLSATNCLFDRVNLGVGGGNAAQYWMRNCTMRGGSLSLSKYGLTWPVWIEECAFDGTSLAVDDTSGGNTNITYCDFNAFLTNGSQLPLVPALHNVTNLASFNWQSSWLGNFYQSTNSPLINAGSTTADKFGLYHFTTQTNQVKETNSLVDIGYHYVAVNANGQPVDSNGDGTPDCIADANGNGLVDNGETAWLPAPVITSQPVSQMVIQGSNATFSVAATSLVKPSYLWYFNSNSLTGANNSALTISNAQLASTGNYWVVVGNGAGSATSSIVTLKVLGWLVDSDYDGRNDAPEILDGTDPFNPNSVLPVGLAYFSFDNTNTWAGSAGQLPLVASNVVGVPSWSTNAVRLDTNKPAILCYRDVETNGNANINLRSGTVRFWFNPDWTSVSAGGSGPGAYGRMIEMGSNNPVLNVNSWTVSQTNGWWSLFFTPDGNHVVFGSSTNGAGGVNLSAGIAWTSNQWHQVVLAYSPTNSSLYVDGQLAANGAASSTYPNLAERSQGFRIGSDQNGANQARGAFDELETFNYPLVAAVIATNYQNRLNWSSSGSGLPNLWQWNNFGYEGVDPTGNPAGDGLSNLQKYQNNLNPHQFDPVRLGYWRFNNPPAWLDESNLAPGTAYGLYPVPDWSGDAVRITAAQNSVLSYPGIRANGSAVAICPAGTGSLRFWFKPDWCSGLGQGPGGVARLFEVGEPSTNAAYGWFSLGLDPWGSTLTFSTEANGLHTDNASCPLNFTTNTWYQIVLTYSPSNSALYVNGVGMATNGFGVTNLPSQAILQQGFHFGGSWDGVDQANGDFDELETFNYPLEAADVASNYQSAMSVLAVDGLPVIVKDGWGLRSDSWDSDCDGLPDAWKLANGLNPLNPNVATPAALQLYEGITGATNAYFHVSSPKDIISFCMSTNVQGPGLVGYGSNDCWNSWNTDLLAGQPLIAADNSSTGAKLFAFIGPCKNTFWYADKYYQPNLNAVPPEDPYSYSSQELGFLYGAPMLLDSFFSNNGPYWWYVFWLNDWGAQYADAAIPPAISSVDSLGNGTTADIVGYYLDSVYPYQLRSDDDARWNAIANVVAESQLYGNRFASYFTNAIGYSSQINPHAAAGNYAAFGALDCFVPAFSAVTNVPIAAGGGGLLQAAATFAYPNLYGQSFSALGNFFPLAKRSILLSGLQHGTYDVYVYYSALPNCPPAQINGVAAVPLATPAGMQYWTARVSSTPFTTVADIVKFKIASGYVSGHGPIVQAINVASSMPPWAFVTNSDYLQINLASPLVIDPSQDINLLGIQIVKQDTVAAPVLQVRPGLGAAYLIWQPTEWATNYVVYRSVGSSNSWAKIGSTAQLQLQDTNLTTGTTYYYQVQSTNQLGSVATSSVVSVVPFGCQNPLPPRIDYVNQLQIPVANGVFPITYQMLLTNSDALDPQGYPLVFKVDSVASGSLTIDGVPFSGANNTIGTTNSVVWTAPAVMAAAATPAFRVYVSDGLNRSSNTVNVLIKQAAKTFLMAWGENSIDAAFTVGYLGTGTIRVDAGYAGNMAGGYLYLDDTPIFGDQNRANIYPNMAAQCFSWDNPSNLCYAMGSPPAQVLNLDSVSSISCWGDNAFAWQSGLGHCAITPDKRMWFWGDVYSYMIGMPLVVGYSPATSSQYNVGPTNWNTGLDPNTYWTPLRLTLPSPVPVLDPNTGQPLTGVVMAKDQYILKNDGTLWSLGNCKNGVVPTIGRQVVNADDAYDEYDMSLGLKLGQVEIDGNDRYGVRPGREIVEINTCGHWLGGTAAVARCKDGSVWSWGSMDDGTSSEFVDVQYWFMQLSGDNYSSTPDVLPVELTGVEAASSSPIVQIAQSGYHVVIWRQDGSLSEIGYIPGRVQPQDIPGGADVLGLLQGQYDMVFHPGPTYNFDYVYQTLPVVLDQVPSGIRQIAVSPIFGSILTQSGDVWVWGEWLGQVLVTPKKIATMSGIVKIIAGGQYIIGLDKRGRLWGAGINNEGAFGFNDCEMIYGREGSGDTPHWIPRDVYGTMVHSNAVQIPGIENVVDVFSGDDHWSSQVYAIGTQVQGKPTGLTATAMNQAVQLTWTNYPAAASYIVYRSLNADSGYVAIGTTAVNSFADNTSLQNGQTYYYEVSAVVNGVETATSWEVSATPYPAPGAVGQLSALWACSGIELQWQPPANVAVSPLDDYLVVADNVQLAELPPGAINYFDSREVIASNCVYQVIARNSSGQAGRSIQLSSATPTNGCPPAPVIATNSGSGCWLNVTAGTDGGSDHAALVWTGTAPANGTNSSWLFQATEFDTFPGIPGNPSRPQIDATETVDNFVQEMAGADPDGNPVAAWLWSQITNSEQTILTAMPQVTSAADTANMLATNSNALQSWLWAQFSPSVTNILLSPTSDDSTIKNTLSQALLELMAPGQLTNFDESMYVAQLYQQVINSSGLASADQINQKLTILTYALDQILTNGAPLTNDFFVTAIQQGYFITGAQLRPETINLATNLPPPQGAALVQLKRMLLDDYFQSKYFTRGGNWAGSLSGFRIHYRTVQYVNGQKLVQNLQQDVPLSRLNYGWDSGFASHYYDDENIQCGVYAYSWSIPQGALCWASVAAMVNGQESLLSDEVGPQTASPANSWNAGLQAISGYQQVYLEWNDDPSAIGYTVYCSTNSEDTNNGSVYPDVGSWLPVTNGINLQLDWFWHTNFAGGVTNYYYFVQADDYFSGTLNSGAVSATVTTNVPPPAANQFSAAAYPYDSMVDVEWTVPTNQNSAPVTSLNQTNWQFYVERKPAATADANYVLVTDRGFGLAYLDTDVVNGQSYTYRVTAFDTAFNRLQALAVAGGGANLNTQITPSPTNGLTLLPPVPGNSYVNLTWSPIRATQFSIKRAQNPAGPFTVVGSQNVNDAYQSAQNSYQDTGLQNGVMYYYQVAAITPTGFEVDSPVVGAMPLATLTPLPPSGFQGAIVPVGSTQLTNTVALSWNAETGVNQYQVFLQDQSSLTLLFAGRGTSAGYTIPDAQQADTTAVFTFALRSIGAQGLTSDFAFVTITNQQIAQNVPLAESPVVLQIGGAVESSLIVAGPTNLTLCAVVNIPNVSQVTFYDGAQIIGTVTSAPYQMTWYHVPGGPHQQIQAVALASSATASYVPSGNATFNSQTIDLTVNVEPQLSAYQTSATDLQLPAPALPISLSRSYSSRSASTNGVLGVGWTAGWNMASVTLVTDLASQWSGIYQFNLGSYYAVSETVAHYVTVNLPNGQSVSFFPELNYGNAPLPTTSLPAQYDDFGIVYTNFAPNQGSLQSEYSDLVLNTDASDPDEWTGSLDFGGPFDPGQFTYVGPDGTTNVFAQPLGDGVTWLLTQTTDLNGNSLNYVYDPNTTNLVAISNSCGRQVTFGYTRTAYGTNISVTDMLGGNPSVVYVVSNSLLTEVHQLINRTSATYLTNSYAYGSDANHAPADFLRLTDVYDARGIRVLHNTYTNDPSTGQLTGDLATQISPGKTNNFTIDSSFNLIVTATTSTATNTVQVNSDASGSISGAMQPVSGSAPSTTPASQCTYDSQGNLISQTDANGNTTTYTYDAQNRLIGQSDGNSDSTSTALNNYGQPTLSTDANGNQTAYVYDSNGNTLSVSDPSGTSTGYGYSSPVTVGNAYLGAMQTSQSQVAPFVPYSIVTLNSYNSAGPSILGDLLQTTEEWQDSGGKVVGKPVITQYTYDANGNRLTETKTRSTVSGTGTGLTETILTAYTYDAQNRVLATTVSASNNNGMQTLPPQTTTVAYNALGKQVTSTDAAGRVTTNVYDFNGYQIETDYPDGTVSRTCYDGFGHQQYVQDRAVPDAASNTVAPATLSFYDPSGRVIKTERCDAVKLTKTPASSSDFTALANSAPQVKMVVASPGTVLTTNLTFYDPVGNVQYSVDARGAVTQYQYDTANRRTNVLVFTAIPFVSTGLNPPSPSGPSQSTSYTYDANGNQVTVTDAAGHTTTSHYDQANRVIQVDYPAANGGTVSQYTAYDGLGRKLQQNDEAGVATAYTYDFRGLLTSVTLAFGTTQSVTTVYGYDELGNEIAQTDAAGHSTTFQYDALGRKTARSLPGGQTETFGYDLAGNQIYQTNFSGVIITNQYEWASGRLTNCSTLGYQASYAYSPTGLRTNMADPSGTTRYRYDDQNRLTNKLVTWTGGPAVALNYSYDPLGSLTNLWSSTANGVTNVYRYDLLGRLTNVLAGAASAASYGYDVVGNLQTLRYANGVTNLYQYDSRNRLTNLVWQAGNYPLASYAYTVGPTGNRLALTENGGSRVYNWAYDYLYRLTGETFTGTGTSFGFSGSPSVTYGFDAVGNRTNRTSAVTGISTQTATYTANDWLASDKYDANGNTTNSGALGYQYDVMGHLTNVNSGQILITYDGDGNRVKKTVNGTTTYYLVEDRNPSGYAQVLEEYQGTSLTRVYNYGLALINQQLYDANSHLLTSISYFGTDGHGSTRFLTDASANLTDTYTFDAYGLLMPGASSGSTPNNYLYCGQQWDSDLGFYYLRARYYKPDSGRFWTMDTYEGNSEDPLSLHKYLYCKGNPVNGRDPSGHDGEMEGQLMTTGIIGMMQRFSLTVVSRTLTFVAKNPGLLRAFLIAQAFVTIQAVHEDPANAYVYWESGGFFADAKMLGGLVGDVKGAMTLYRQTDQAGRACGVFARLTRESIGTGTEVAAGVSVPGADATRGLQKGHLLGAMLGGRGDIAGNLTPISESINNGPMKSIEFQVRAAVEAGETVEYRVTPMFEGNSEVPRYIKIEANGDKGFILTTTFENNQ